MQMADTWGDAAPPIPHPEKPVTASRCLFSSKDAVCFLVPPLEMLFPISHIVSAESLQDTVQTSMDLLHSATWCQ